MIKIIILFIALEVYFSNYLPPFHQSIRMLFLFLQLTKLKDGALPNEGESAYSPS